MTERQLDLFNQPPETDEPFYFVPWCHHCDPQRPICMVPADVDSWGTPLRAGGRWHEAALWSYCAHRQHLAEHHPEHCTGAPPPPEPA